MTRKLAAIIITTLLLFGLFPAAAAFGSATGTASLTSARTLFPQDNTSVSFNVVNGETALTGKTINYVSIILPVDRAGVVLDERSITAPAGWTAAKDVVGSYQAVVFKSSNAGVPAGQTGSFSIPVDIKRPASTDRTGPFEIAVSSDGGKTTKRAAPTAAGALDINVKILEILGGSLGATEPAGVTDQSATGSQSIKYGYAIRNYALNAVSVTSTLTSSAADVVKNSPQVVSVAGDPAASTPVSFDVDLATAAADRTSTFTAGASAVGATAAGLNRNLSVEAIPVLSASSIAPSRVRSGLGANYAFEVDTTKSGTPRVDISKAILSFATTSTPVEGQPVYPRNAANSKLKFQQTEVSGTNGTFAPTIAFEGIDANGKSFAQTVAVTANVIIDNLAPLINGVTIGLPSGQSALKDGDDVTVTGTITQAADDLKLDTLKVRLDPNVGNDITVAATTTKQSDGSYTFTGTANDIDWADGTTEVVAKAEVADLAGNSGGGTSARELVDLFVPTLKTPGTVEATNLIRVEFADNLAAIVSGGCDPRSYFVGGTPGRVSKVTYADGSDCAADKPAPSSARFLTLNYTMDSDDTPPVTYRADALVNNSPAQDGAKNSVVTTTINTISGLVPLAPVISGVTRNGGAETAYSETATDGVKTYFTRFPGTGTLSTEDLNATFTNARSGYLIQVVDANKAVLASTTLSNPAALATSKEFTASMRVPIGKTDATYVRGLRMVGTNGKEGAITWFNVTLDQVLPTLTTRTLQSDNSTVVVKLAEPIVGGTDYASDWLAFENLADGTQYYRAMEVASTDSTTRTITFPLQNPGSFGGVHYRMTSEDGKRYEDRAGNLMANTLQ